MESVVENSLDNNDYDSQLVNVLNQIEEEQNKSKKENVKKRDLSTSPLFMKMRSIGTQTEPQTKKRKVDIHTTSTSPLPCCSKDIPALENYDSLDKVIDKDVDEYMEANSIEFVPILLG